MKYLLCALIFLVSTSSFANLVDEVDKLTPEEAYLVQQKLKAKTAEPIPESFFTHMAFMVDGSYHFADPDAPSPLNNEDFDSMNGFAGSILWKTNNHFRWGMGFGFIYNSRERDLGSGVFEDIKLYATYFQLQFAYRFLLGEKFAIMPTLGAGGMMAKWKLDRSDDNTQASYNYNIQAFDFSGLGKLNFMYYINPVLSIGAHVGYLFAKLNDVERSGTSPTAGEINLNGLYAGTSIGINI